MGAPGKRVERPNASRIAGRHLATSQRSVVDRFGPKLIEFMSQFPTADAFASASLAGTGAKSAGQIINIIHADARTNLNPGQVNREVRANGDWYYLHRIPVSQVDARTHGVTTPSGAEDLSKPIIIGLRKQVLDGRHRVELARAKGVSNLPAYLPAKLLYQMLMT